MILSLAQCVLTQLVMAQSPYAVYQTEIELDLSGSASFHITYTIFAGDSELNLVLNDIRLPVLNSSSVLNGSINVVDSYGASLSWTWDDGSNLVDFLRVVIGPLSIPAGGKYEATIKYRQSSVARRVNETYYFVYEWDFAGILYSPQAIRDFLIEVKTPQSMMFDDYVITYIGTAPASLNSSIAKVGSRVTLNYSTPVQYVTLNVYFEHVQTISPFIPSIIFIFLLTLAVFIILRRRRRAGGW